MMEESERVEPTTTKALETFEREQMMSIADQFTAPPETRMVLENVAWEIYVALADYERRGSVPRMTYDEGVLEMMSPAREHENIGCLIGRMIEAYSELRDIEVISVASMTVKRSDLVKGFEADESYYVTHAAELFGKKKMDFQIDPAPDLVVEVEITSSAIEKMKLFAAMSIPEVWRFNGKSLTMNRLTDQGYKQIDSSVELPGLSSTLVNQMLTKRDTIGETKLIKEFRQHFSGTRQGA